MNESAEYTRLLAQAYSKLADDYVAMTQRVIAADNRVKELDELLEKWALHAARESERADAAEAMREHHAACCRDYLARNQQLEQRADAAEARVDNLWRHSKAAQARIIELNRELDAEISEKTARIIEESNRADAAEARVKELEATFDLRWNADQRAIKRWQKAHPDKPLTWPDRADLILWHEARLCAVTEAGDDMREWVQSWKELHPRVADALVDKVLRRWDAARQQGGGK